MAFPVPNFDGAYLLLAYTIENLLKGLLIAQKKEHISESKLPKNLRSHDLWELYKMSGAKTELQERTLRSLTYMSVWRGRYPAPTSPQDLYFRSDNGRQLGPALRWPDIISEIIRGIDNLEAEVVAMLQQT
jgi:hypothetical protein